MTNAYFVQSHFPYAFKLSISVFGYDGLDGNGLHREKAGPSFSRSTSVSSYDLLHLR